MGEATITKNNIFDPESDVDDTVQEAIKFVSEKLQRRTLKPVKRKLCKVVHERLLSLQACLNGTPTPHGDEDNHVKRRINGTLALLYSKNENALWDFADSLKELMIEIGPSDLVFTALVEEKGREYDSPHKWDEYFQGEDLDSLIASYEKDSKSFDRKKASQRLLSLYKLRDDEGRHSRTRDEMRWKYLLWMSGFLLIATFASACLAVVFNDQLSARNMFVVGTAGAAGAILSGTLRFRQLASIVELKSAWQMLSPQMVLGTSLALIVVLILATDVIKIGGLSFEDLDNTTFFVIGLLSGFSEPFALGILESFANLRK